LVGAHVQVVGGSGATYIVPLCKAHNRDGGLLTLWVMYKLVSANKALTCERP
jgi:hypothetical protein